MVTDTRAQVLAQLAAMGCDTYEIGIIPPRGRPDLRPERTRTWNAATIVRALPFLRARNANGFDIFIRPAPLEDGRSAPLAFVDDLDEAAIARMHADGLAFAARIKSSAGRYHGWVRLAEEPLPREEVMAAAKRLAERYGGDPAAAAWSQYGRLAGFTNRKPVRALVKDVRRHVIGAVRRHPGLRGVALA